LGVEGAEGAVELADVDDGLGLAVEGAVAAQGAGFAAFFAVEDVGAGDGMVAVFHEDLFGPVLDAFDVDEFAANGFGEDAGDGGFGGFVNGELVGFGEGVVFGDGEDGFEGVFDGQVDAGFVEGFDAAVAFADGEFASFEGVNACEVKLAFGCVG
jgi:hypothetical protein